MWTVYEMASENGSNEPSSPALQTAGYKSCFAGSWCKSCFTGSWLQGLLCRQPDTLQMNRRAAYMKRPSSSLTGTSPLMTPFVSRARECSSSQASLMNATLSATTTFSKSFVSTLSGICFHDEFQGGCSPERMYSVLMFEPTLSSRECCSGQVSTQQRVDHDTSIVLEV